MTESITGTATSSTRFSFQNSAPLSSTFAGTAAKTYARNFISTDVTKLYFNSYTVTSTPTSIDLTGLTDVFGVALNFGVVKHLQVVNNDQTNNLTVGGGVNGLFAALPVLVGQNPATGSLGSSLNLTTNVTVDGTHKILTLVASAGSITVDVVVAGT